MDSFAEPTMASTLKQQATAEEAVRRQTTLRQRASQDLATQSKRRNVGQSVALKSTRTTKATLLRQKRVQEKIQEAENTKAGDATISKRYAVPSAKRDAMAERARARQREMRAGAFNRVMGTMSSPSQSPQSPAWAHDLNGDNDDGGTTASVSEV
jgi:hypothetical protein